jgi:hypothetical protein
MACKNEREQVCCSSCATNHLIVFYNAGPTKQCESRNGTCCSHSNSFNIQRNEPDSVDKNGRTLLPVVLAWCADVKHGPFFLLLLMAFLYHAISKVTSSDTGQIANESFPPRLGRGLYLVTMSISQFISGADLVQM